MTKDRDFKRVVRQTAKRTGEPYQRTRAALDDAGAHQIEQATGLAVAQLALRMADGKPTMPPLPWTDEMREVQRAALEAAEVAQLDGASAIDRERARHLRAEFARLSAEARASAPERTPTTYIEATIAGRIEVARVAAGECHRLLALNPRDRVAAAASELLAAVIHGLEQGGQR